MHLIHSHHVTAGVVITASPPPLSKDLLKAVVHNTDQIRDLHDIALSICYNVLQKTHEIGVAMSLTITVSPDVEAAIRAVAEFEGRDPSEVTSDALRVRYVGASEATLPTREGQLALESARHNLEEADFRHRQKYGLSDLSVLTPPELEKYAAEGLAAADPAHVAEAERLGLL